MEVANSNSDVREVTALWAGGWDKYHVDTSQIIEATESELTRYKRGDYSPQFQRGSDDWLLCRFLKGSGIGTETQAVRVLRHLGGGS